ncbi:hypothetical protein B4V02_07280 [Paenibacillus kribbensis]|uniref:Uncharacterized protein n=1 Tax=Paenibacillus kribbensis TaxID=172713 RepID=A0A222WKL6_9BACL|nr:three component ABC system middle component [Paenibacillus kribbensis]ASR46494.1 hypothetical protein B4V02_07280 [Paenibacillus kribbensis]
MDSIDVFSVTNPALGSLVLWSFLQGYENKQQKGCPFPLVFFPLPLVISKSIRDEFKGTNAETGLYTWITRKQSILVNLDIRINRTSQLTRSAVIFGCANELMNFQPDGTIISRSRGLYKNRLQNSSEEIKQMVNTSRKLGIWFSQIDSTASILNSLGLTL